MDAQKLVSCSEEVEIGLILFYYFDRSTLGDRHLDREVFLSLFHVAANILGRKRSAHEASGAESKAQDDAHGEFMAQDLEPIGQGNLSEGHGTRDKRGSLRPRIAAGGNAQRHE